MHLKIVIAGKLLQDFVRDHPKKSEGLSVKVLPCLRPPATLSTHTVFVEIK